MKIWTKIVDGVWRRMNINHTALGLLYYGTKRMIVVQMLENRNILLFLQTVEIIYIL